MSSSQGGGPPEGPPKSWPPGPTPTPSPSPSTTLPGFRPPGAGDAPQAYPPQQVQQPYPPQPQQAHQPYPPQQQQAHQPYPPQPQPYPPPQQPPYPPGAAPLPHAVVVRGSASSDSEPLSELEEVPRRFVAFLKISSRRAFRLRIEPSEVLPAERAELEAAMPPILDLNLQAFLAWRRSVLFLVAVALVPLSVIGLIDSLVPDLPTPIRLVKLGPAIAESLFCLICWVQLKRWAHWRTQRRMLFFGWLLFMITPFIVFLYPLRTIFEDLAGSRRETLLALGVDGVYKRAVMPFVFAMIAMLQLAPKAISLMPGLIRASLVIKLLFPGAPAPGWLIVMAAPLYALLAYVILIIPYQFTGSGWFVAGVLGVVLGQAMLARAGFALARPLSEEEALVHIKRVRVYYVTVMVISAVLIVVALGSLVDHFHMRITDVVTAVMKFETNVLILTMIGSDLVITNLDRAREQTAGKAHVEEQTEGKIAAFVSEDHSQPHQVAPLPPDRR